MVRFFKGNVLDSTADAITITVNCKGVMGKGVALEAKQRYPTLFAKYKELCDRGEMKVGKPIICKVNGKHFILFPTKDDWRKPSELQWIESGLAELARHASQFKTIAMSPLGCGNGGLDIFQVTNRILNQFENAETLVGIYLNK